MIFDLFAQIFSGITGAAAQTTAQTTTPPAHSPNTLGNLFQFDADGGAGWASSAFGEPPEWAPWHPNFDEFANYGPDGTVTGGIGVNPQGLGAAGFPNTMSRGNGQTSQTQTPTSSAGGSPSNTDTSSSSGGGSTGTPSLAERNALPPAPGHDAYVDDAREVNNPDVSNKITAQTAPTLVDQTPEATRGIEPRPQLVKGPQQVTRGGGEAPKLVRGPQQVTRSVPLPEQSPISTDSQTRGTPSAQPTQPSMGTPGSHPELPAHQDVNTPELPELNTGRKLSIPLVKQTLGVSEGIQRGAWKTLTTPATKATGQAIFRQGGVVVNMDSNWAPASKGGITSPGVVIPDGATKAQRAAAWKYAKAMAQVHKEQFGRKVKPWVRTRTENGRRGRPGFIHTEGFAVTDKAAAQYFSSEAGAKRHAAILSRTLGTIPGVHFSIPHDGVSGAADNGTSEVKLAEGVMRWLQPDN